MLPIGSHGCKPIVVCYAQKKLNIVKMNKIEKNKINVFISYSWDSKEHQQWVLSIADLINEKGGNPIVDRIHLKYGGHIKTFMLKSILRADVVLIILTPKYKKKADHLEGGAGYEYNIINDELFKIITENDKYIPVIREGNFESSVTSFLQGFNCVDLRESNQYNDNLKELLSQILDTPLKQPSPHKEKKTIMEKVYKALEPIVAEMNSKALKYFEQLFKVDYQSMTKAKIKLTIQSWESEIQGYHGATKEKFNPSKMEIYEDYLEDFKNNVFGKELWTVKAALKTHDPDLARYKKDFRDADAVEIFETVNSILNATHKYVQNDVLSINYQNIESIEKLKMQYLNENEMFMNKIIGFGIRSEILHRYYPANLPIMTQKSLWAMYFICDSANEFITIEQRNRQGIMRVSHNWQYPYDRFTYLMNELANQISQWFEEYDLKLKPQYRFGYVNMFLSAIQESHKSDIKLLHAWVEKE